MGIDRAIALLDDEPRTPLRSPFAFEHIFLLILATEYGTRALALWSTLDAQSAAYVVLGTACCVLAWRRATRTIGFIGLAVVQLLVLHRDFPQAGNHAYLELIFCVLLATLDPQLEAERGLLVRAVRWIVCSVLFWSGIQKLIHGYYFHGEQLAHSLHIESFRAPLALLIRPDEMARLSAYTGAAGDGPYTIASPMLLAASNAVYVTEIALAALLLLPRTRTAAIVATLLFLAVVESAAREVFFGLVFADAVLMFRRGGVPARMLPAVAAILLCLLAVRLGILPAVTFY